MSIALVSILCGLVVVAWVRLASIVFALYYGAVGKSSTEVSRLSTSGYASPAMIIFLGLATVALALLLFAIGAISLPMIADRNTDVVSTVQASLRALRRNTAIVPV